jgi:hypothetical protein
MVPAPEELGKGKLLGVVKFALPPYSVEVLDSCGPVDLIAPVRSRVFGITRLTKSHWDYVARKRALDLRLPQRDSGTEQ